MSAKSKSAAKSTQNESSRAQAPAKKPYFDLIVSGIGFVNRPREVSPNRRGASPYLAVTIAALRGSTEDGQRAEVTYFDTIVVGSNAKELLRKHWEDVSNKDNKVMVTFSLGDPRIETFEYPESSEKAGQMGASLKARLLSIDWMKVNETVVYQASMSETPADQAAAG